MIPTILCGGAGSRLWPVSRELHPKPFIQLADGQSFLQKAFLRASHLWDVDEILTVTNHALFLKTKEELNEVNREALHTEFILEPFGRNTAAAITAAALHIAKRHGEDALVLVLAADHLVSDFQAFHHAVNTAMKLAICDKLVTFGIEAITPETGYGYIEAEGNKVVRFVEKPTLELAESYVKSGRFLWNSGMFCFKAATFLLQMDVHAPDILAATKLCMEKSVYTAPTLLLEALSFHEVPDNSIDYALMEKSEQVAVVPCDMGWQDIGSWHALAALREPNPQGNRIEGDTVLHDVENCYIQSSDRCIGAIGIKNLMIVDTPDALLVADQSRTQDVKHLYAALKKQNHEAYKSHRTVCRPWGTYTVLEEGDRFKIKRIVVNPGASLSLQMHHHRSEHWVVVSGEAKVTNGDVVTVINTNESTYIPAGNKHRLENTTKDPVVLIEVQSGDYVGEDDIVRFEDVYGRVMENV